MIEFNEQEQSTIYRRLSQLETSIYSQPRLTIENGISV